MTKAFENNKPVIRRLWPTDQPSIINHFLSLDHETRRLRFGAAVGDAYLRNYADKVLSLDALVLGAFFGAQLRGVAELRRSDGLWPSSAEAAFSVQRDWQDRGLGDALVSRIVSAARNRSIKSLRMICLRENERMQHLAMKHNAIFDIGAGEIEATLTPPWPTFSSITQEIFGETRGWLHFLNQFSKQNLPYWQFWKGSQKRESGL